MKQKDDPTIERIREARHRISDALGHDPKKLVDHYAELQKKYKERIVKDTDSEKGEKPVRA